MHAVVAAKHVLGIDDGLPVVVTNRFPDTALLGIVAAPIYSCCIREDVTAYINRI